MDKNGMALPWLLLLVAVLVPGKVFAAREHDAGHQHQHQHHQHHKAENGGSPLVEEMLLLDEALREIVSAVAVGDNSRVQQALEPLHGTMEKTHEAVHEGAVHIPKNADRVEEFVKMDKKFHKDLEALAAAAAKNDAKAMLDLTKKLMDGCVACHQKFRK